MIKSQRVSVAYELMEGHIEIQVRVHADNGLLYTKSRHLPFELLDLAIEVENTADDLLREFSASGVMTVGAHRRFLESAIRGALEAHIAYGSNSG